MVFTWIDWKVVEVACAGVKSETSRTTSASLIIIPFVLIRSKVFEMLASISSDKSTRSGITPHYKFKAIRALLSLVNANIGGQGRLRDKSDAISPCFVYTKMASTPRLLDAEEKHQHKFQIVMAWVFWDDTSKINILCVLICSKEKERPRINDR